MELPLATPAIIFPTISFLFLAYTNRYLAISSRIRELYSRYTTSHESLLREQIEALRRRLKIIRSMQLFGVLSLFSCLLAILSLLDSITMAGIIFFVASLLLLCGSLFFAALEILSSTKALDILLSEMETHQKLEP
jgi:hypothetical protein